MNANVHKTKYSDFTAVMALFQTLLGSLIFLTTMFSTELILSLFVAGAGLCAASEVWKCDFRGRRKDS